MDRMIECPFCRGRTVIPCGRCANSRRIPDRRALTANDRAVERIKEWCAMIPDPGRPPELCAAEAYVCGSIMDIIREEAERG